jgi:hypothetical protein
MTKNLITLLLLAPVLAWAQPSSGPASFFINLKNGETVYANSLTQESRFFGSGYLLVNGVDKYDLKDVKSYRSPDGFFRKFGQRSSRDSWYKMEEEGEINVYSRIVRSSTPSGWNGGMYGGTYHPGMYSVSKVEYFQTGEAMPERLRFAPLKDLMLDSRESLEIMHKGRNRAVTRGVLMGVGVGLFLAGSVLTFQNLGSENSSQARINPLVYVGGVACLVPLFIPSPTRDYRRAITVYNLRH